LMQLELFNLYGFVHCDIHLGNFLIGKTPTSEKDDEIIFNVSSQFEPVKFKIKNRIVMTDFENSKILFKSLNPDITDFLKDKNNINYNNTLQSNIMNVFYWTLDLLQDDFIREKFKKIIYAIPKLEQSAVKALSSYARNEYDEYHYKDIVLNKTIQIIRTLFDQLFDNKYEFIKLPYL